jgi:phosphonate transport system permease protein
LNSKDNLIFAIVIALLIVSSYNIGIDPAKFIDGLPNLAIVVREMAQIDLSLLNVALLSMLETIQMAFIGTIVGFGLSLPLSLLAARNVVNSKFIYGPIRAFLAGIRILPSILWAIFFVIIVGLGPFAGILAIVLYTIGFITKLQYESLESIEPDSMDAIGSTGVSKIQLIRFVVIPQAATHLISQLLYMFDYNVRQSSILGVVGAGGIGFYIINYIKFFDYGKAAVFIMVVFVVALMIDYVSVKVRDRYIAKTHKGVSVRS